MNKIQRELYELGTATSSGGGGLDRLLLSTLGHTSGTDLTISPGVELFNDLSGHVFGVLTIADGAKYTIDPSQDITMTALQVMNDGIWQISAEDGYGPYTHKFTCILNGATETKTPRPNDPYSGNPQGFTSPGLSRVINNHGTRYWRGVPKLHPKTRLSRHANTGATDCYLVGDCSDYAIGDDIVIAPTGFAGQTGAERRTITSVGAYASGLNETRVFWTTPLTQDHWGLLQYPIDAPYGSPGISLTPGTFTPPDADTLTVYDARAEVLNVSNGNIVVMAPSDTAWTTNGTGARIMDHPLSTYYDEGVRVINGGGKAILAGYPFHSHRQSFADVSSPVTFDLTGALVRVNWVGHGITPAIVRIGSGVFVQDPYVNSGIGLGVKISGDYAALVGGGAYVTLSASGGSSLPPNVTPGRVYYLCPYGGDEYAVCTAYTGNQGAPGAPVLPWVSNGTGTVQINASVSDQPMAFTTTGTLPSSLATGTLTLPTAQFAGSSYPVVGSSITADSFCIFVAPSAGAGSGVHTAKYTRFTQDRPDCRRIKCTVDTSVNRAFVIHATCGTEVSDCIAYDIRGQAFFLEDASEERNKLYRNTALLVRNPVAVGDRLKAFDGDPYDIFPFEFNASGFWLSNPYNDVQDNMGILCDGSGVHNSFGSQAFGISTLVNVRPYHRDIYRWARNGGHSNWNRGVMTHGGVTDEFGRSTKAYQTGGNYEPQSVSVGASGHEANLMEGIITYFNRQGGYFNNVQGVGPFYKGGVCADNYGGGFEGGTSNAVKDARSILFIGHSLMPGPTIAIDNGAAEGQPIPVFGNATYHFTLFFDYCSYHNLPWVRPYYKRQGQQDYGGGGYSWRDLYVDSVAAQFSLSNGNKYNNAHPGQLTREPRLAGYPVTLTLANPCVVTADIADVTSGTREFMVCENEPLAMVRVSKVGGTFPAPLTKGMIRYAKNARDVNGNLVGTSKTGVTWELSATPGGASISTAGSTQVGKLAMHPLWRDANTPWIHGMGTIMPDPHCYYGSGSTGSTPRWVCPYSDEPFFAYDAANFVSCEPITADGLFGLGFSTTDDYIGFANLFTDKTRGTDSVIDAHSGIRAVRYNDSDMSVIGTYNLESLKVGESPFFQDFQHSAMKNRGAYSIKAASDIAAPTSHSAIRLILANIAAIDLMMAIEFSGAVVANRVFRTIGGIGAPSDPDAGTGMSVTCTSVGSYAVAKASSDGTKFWQDTTNNLVWVRWASLPGNAAYEAYLASLSNSDGTKAERSSWFVVQHV